MGRNTIALIYYYITMTLEEEIKELKVIAYDLIAQSEFIQYKLQEVNTTIKNKIAQAESEANKA